MSIAPVTVIVAAFRAVDTIAFAVRSALAEPEVGEVIVVDDASPDATAQAAMAANDGTGRLRVLHQPTNLGPSAARNRALGEARLPLAAILDADDRLLPGRFAPLLKIGGWDFIADNIAFVREEGAVSVPDGLPGGSAVRRLAPAEFVDRNISRRGRRRGELGFLKPVFRREFLVENGLRYPEDVRLGEDFLLYAAAMARGARFLIAERCGYLAIEREGSLSGRHSTHDLRRLRDGSRSLLVDFRDDRATRVALTRHARSLTVKVRHRELLDDKAATGVPGALAQLLKHPRDVVPVARAIWHDKMARPTSLPVRLLFGPDDFDQSRLTS